jgi:hypothetical protein
MRVSGCRGGCSPRSFSSRSRRVLSLVGRTLIWACRRLGVRQLPAWWPVSPGSFGWLAFRAARPVQIRNGCGRPASRANAVANSSRQGQCSAMRPSLALASGDPGGDVQEPVAQRLRFTDGEVTVQEDGLGPGDQVVGGQGQVQPDHVDGDMPGGNRPRPVSLAQRMRSSTRAWARCRASRPNQQLTQHGSVRRKDAPLRE